MHSPRSRSDRDLACRAWSIVQAAFLLVVLFPPPAAGALGLTLLHCARAGRAADRQEALIVQRIDRNAVLPHERDDTLARPVEQRIDFDERTSGIDRRIGRRSAL